MQARLPQAADGFVRGSCNYESNAPVYVYEYSDHIEIINPGGLYGEATPQNFPNASDYRNVVIAESLRTLGFVNRFNYGVKRQSMSCYKMVMGSRNLT